MNRAAHQRLRLALVGMAAILLATGHVYPAWVQHVDCKEPLAQQDMNLCAARVYEEADAELNSVWKKARAVAQATDAELPRELKGAEQALLTAQRAWIAFRDGACELAGFEARGGSMEPMLVSGCLADLTRIRTKELKHFIGDSEQSNVAPASADDAALTGRAADELRDTLQSVSPVAQCQWVLSGEGTEGFYAKSYDLGEGRSLYLVVCTTGAYQPTTMVFLRGTDVPTTLAFADYSTETGWTGTLELGSVDFDPKTGVLSNYARFRGAGDCGTRSSFKWTGYRFKLLQYAYKECSDAPIDENADIGDFPVIYRAKN